MNDNTNYARPSYRHLMYSPYRIANTPHCLNNIRPYSWLLYMWLNTDPTPYNPNMPHSRTNMHHLCNNQYRTAYQTDMMSCMHWQQCLMACRSVSHCLIYPYTMYYTNMCLMHSYNYVPNIHWHMMYSNIPT